MSVQEVVDEQITPLELDDVLNIFQRWLYLPDDLPLLAILGTVTANQLAGDPVWLLLVGPPGSGKSELLQAVGALPDVHPVATLTEPALLSGTKQKERSIDAKGGLLRTIGDYGIILAKDFGSVLSMHGDARAQVLAALREIYDGSWTRHVGVDGGRALHWTGKVGLVAGCTPTIDRHHTVMGAMGERFVFMRMREPDDDERGLRTLAHAGQEKTMRRELGEAVVRLFLRPQRLPRELNGAERRRLVSLTTLIVRCRSAVERDNYSREIELVPPPEAPTRLILQLERLLGGLDALGVERAKAWGVVTRVAFDSMPMLRRRLIEVLLGVPETSEMATTEIADEIDYPTTTTRRALEDLSAHGVIRRFGKGSGKSHTWAISAWTLEKWSTNLTVPDISGDPTKSFPEILVKGEEVNSKGEGKRKHTTPDISGKRGERDSSAPDISGKLTEGAGEADTEDLWRLRLEESP